MIGWQKLVGSGGCFSTTCNDHHGDNPDEEHNKDDQAIALVQDEVTHGTSKHSLQKSSLHHHMNGFCGATNCDRIMIRAQRRFLLNLPKFNSLAHGFVCELPRHIAVNAVQDSHSSAASHSQQRPGAL